jgi:predicted DNA-binding ribbon-helix-helix protein
MRSSVVRRSIVVAGHKTSASFEDAFWKTFKEIADGRHLTLSELVAAIDGERQRGNMSSAIRLFVLDFYRDKVSEYEKRDRTSRDVRRHHSPDCANSRALGRHRAQR